jgi:hypothetical protein
VSCACVRMLPPSASTTVLHGRMDAVSVCVCVCVCVCGVRVRMCAYAYRFVYMYIFVPILAPCAQVLVWKVCIKQ